MKEMTLKEYFRWKVRQEVIRDAAKEGIKIVDEESKKPANIVKLLPKEYGK